jgi:hypothetical protein
VLWARFMCYLDHLQATAPTDHLPTYKRQPYLSGHPHCTSPPRVPLCHTAPLLPTNYTPTPTASYCPSAALWKLGSSTRTHLTKQIIAGADADTDEADPVDTTPPPKKEWRLFCFFAARGNIGALGH